jgi:hypothetical protein
MEKFKDVRNIHNFVKAQMVAVAKFAFIRLRIYHLKMDLDEVVQGVLLKSLKKRIKLNRHISVVSDVAEKMIDKLFEVDSSFVKEFQYDDSTQQMLAAKENIDKMDI